MGNLEMHKQELLKNLEQKGYSKEKVEALKERKKEIEVRSIAAEVSFARFDVQRYFSDLKKPKIIKVDWYMIDGGAGTIEEEEWEVEAALIADEALLNQKRHAEYYKDCYDRAKNYIAAYEKVYGVPEE